MVGAAGLEPAACWVRASCSAQLSYAPLCWRHRRESNPRLLARRASTLITELRRLGIGAPGRIQTLDPAGRDRVLSVSLSYRGIGLAGRIRTCGLLVPNEARWPSALRRANGVPGRTRTGICSLRGCRPVPLDDGNVLRLRASPRAALCHTELSKSTALGTSPAQSAESSPPAIWYPTRDSNPEDHVSETCTYSHSVSGA